MTLMNGTLIESRVSSAFQDSMLASPAAAELMDVDKALYYLHNLPECRINVAKGLALLYELEESEGQIYQALTLRSRGTLEIGNPSRDCPDQVFFRLQEDFESEKRTILQERARLQDHLKKENHKIVILEGCIFSLPEPQRSVIVARYIDRLSWPAIQKKLNKSQSRIYSLNREGISGILRSVRNLAGGIVRSPAVSDG